MLVFLALWLLVIGASLYAGGALLAPTLVVLGSLLVTALFVRAFRVRVELHQDCLVVHDLFRTRTVARSDVAGFDVSARLGWAGWRDGTGERPAVRVGLKDGRDVALTPTALSPFVKERDALQREYLATFRRWAQIDEVSPALADSVAGDGLADSAIERADETWLRRVFRSFGGKIFIALNLGLLGFYLSLAYRKPEFIRWPLLWAGIGSEAFAALTTSPLWPPWRRMSRDTKRRARAFLWGIAFLPAHAILVAGLSTFAFALR